MSNKTKQEPATTGSPTPEPVVKKKRGRKPSKKQYFTADVDLAIQEYLKSSNQERRNFLEKLDYWKPEKGSKAFSYFSIVGKNYLILYNNNNYKKKKQKADPLAADEDEGVLRQLGRDERKQEIKDFIDYFTEYIDKNMFTMFKKEHDRKVCDAINVLFKRRENLEIFNKKALYIYIREMTGVETPVITKVTKILKKVYRKLYNEYTEIGYVKV